MGTDGTPDNVRPIRASVDRDAPERREHLDPQQLRELFADEDARWSSVEELIDICGDIDALVSLDDEPLAPDPTELEPLPGRAGVLLDLIEQVVADRPEWEQRLSLPPRLDDETLLTVRRVLARAARHASLLGRRASDARLAAAFVWVVMTGNMQLANRRRRTARELWDWFDVSDAASLGRSIAGDLNMFVSADETGCRQPWTPIVLGDIHVLTAETRKWVIRQRDVCARVMFDQRRAAEERAPMRSVGGGIQLRGRPVSISSALKLEVDRRQQVMLFVGEHVNDPDEILVLSVPDAQLLSSRLQTALAGPAAHGRPA